jgi:L-asparaginase II
MKMTAANPVLVEIRRGGIVESRHRGAAAVVDSRGRLLAAWGDVAAAVFPRSAVKPLQALPLIESGAAERFAVTLPELALACASHGGKSDHVERIRAWLIRLGLGEGDLICGAHPPLDEAAARALIRAGDAPSPLHNNCSGKHTGFLALALHLGASLRGYADPQHPVQQHVVGTLARTGGFDAAAAPMAIDGCGAPVIAMPLAALAGAFATLAASERAAPPRQTAIRRVAEAMSTHPGLVGGPGRFDTVVMEAAAGAILVKGGAEGVGAAALMGRGLGLAVKIDDGAKRGAEAALAALIRRFGGTSGQLDQILAAWADTPLHNSQGLAVGAIACTPEWLK